jgi:pyruvate kinase
MLSEESAMGDFPVEAVATMRDICIATDKSNDPRHEYTNFDHAKHAVQKAAVDVALNIDAKAIIALTETGTTPFVISRFRNRIPIIAVSDKSEALGFLSLAHGVSVATCGAIRTIPELRAGIRDLVKKLGVAKTGDRLVIVSGLTFGTTGSTNMLFVETV